jgi:hypothetical protein
VAVDPRAERQLDEGVGDERGRQRDHVMDHEQRRQDDRGHLHLAADGPRKDERGRPAGPNRTQSLGHRSTSFAGFPIA